MATYQELLERTRQQLNERNRPRPEKLRDGKNRYRILPSWRKDGDETFFHSFGQHFIKNDKGEIVAVYICNSRTFGKTCEVCDSMRDALRSAATEEMRDMIKDWGASSLTLVNMIHRDGKDGEKPMLFGLPTSVFDDIFKIAEEYWRENQVMIQDLKEGLDLIIERSGNGKNNTKYTVMVAPKSKPVDPSVMDRVVDIDEYVKQASEQGLQRALSEINRARGILPSSAERKPAVEQPKLIRQFDSKLVDEAEVLNPSTPAGSVKEVLDESDLDAILDGIES